MSEKVVAFEIVPPSRYIRFGVFELDTRAHELRKHGIKIRLRRQTFEILFMLLKNPGEVVLREEIRDRLWPRDTVVEFEHSINTAVQKLRDALGESADDPKYIETLPRRGYRFIGTVEKVPVEPAPSGAPSEIAAAPSPPSAPKRLQGWSPLAIGLAAAIVFLITLVAWLKPWAARPPVGNFTLSLGAISRFEAVVSPDGSSVIYVSSKGLVLRRLDSLDEIPLYGAERLNDSPGWSADGSQILIHSTEGIFRMAVPDGNPTNIWPKTHITRGSSWGAHGAILSATLGKLSGGELYLVPANGGEPALLEVPGLVHGRFFEPEFLPDGDNILFAWMGVEDGDAGLYMATLKEGKVVRGPFLLRRNMTVGHYTPSGGGRFLFVDHDNLYAQRLNLSQAKLQGEPVRIVEGVQSGVAGRKASFSVSRNGVLVWKAGRASLAQLTWFDRMGRMLGTAGPPHVPEIVRLSPDEKHIIIPTTSETAHYSIVESNRTGHLVLPHVTKPVWMPDSADILYWQKEGNSFRVLRRAAERGAETEVARLPDLNTLREVSADGKRFFTGRATTFTPPVSTVRLRLPNLGWWQGRGKGSFPPDGHWLVYSWNAGIYVQPFPSSGMRTQISSAVGSSPVWRGDGKEILFRDGATIYSVPVELKGNTFHAGAPVPLFNVRVPDGLNAESEPLAVSRDGSRILFDQGVEQPDPQLTYVMTAWDSKLKR